MADKAGGILNTIKDYNPTAKEKSLLGIGVFPGFQDFFNTVANDAAPDTTYWTVTESGDASVTVTHDTAAVPGFLSVSSGTTTGNDGVAATKDKFTISLKGGVTTVYFKSRVRINFSADDGDIGGLGLIENELAVANPGGNLIGAAYEVATVVIVDQAAAAYASDGATAESADLSSWIADNTWFDLEIRITASAVTYYVDDTLRATLNTNVPSSCWQLVIGATCLNNAAQTVETQYIRCGAE